jgi:hypothetical protein
VSSQLIAALLGVFVCGLCAGAFIVSLASVAKMADLRAECMRIVGENNEALGPAYQRGHAKGLADAQLFDEAQSYGGTAGGEDLPAGPPPRHPLARFSTRNEETTA